METTPIPVIVIDAANVVGSRPNGWWRDRAGAAAALRDQLKNLATQGLHITEPSWAAHHPVDVIMVVEGQARGIESSATVTVIDATANGDDTIVAQAERAADKRCLVITSDRQLQQRVRATGAETAPVSVIRKHI